MATELNTDFDVHCLDAWPPRRYTSEAKTPYIPKGCDAQGRRPDRAYQPEAAHAASEIDDDDQSEGATADDMTNIVIIPVAITLAMVSLAALVAHVMAGPL